MAIKWIFQKIDEQDGTLYLAFCLAYILYCMYCTLQLLLSIILLTVFVILLHRAPIVHIRMKRPDLQNIRCERDWFAEMAKMADWLM